TLNPGARLLAQVNQGSSFQPGAVTLTAEDTTVRELQLISIANPGDNFDPIGTLSSLAPVGIARKKVAISLSAATIEGGAVSLEASAADESLAEQLAPYVDKLVQNIPRLVNQLPGMLTSVVTGVGAQVNVRSSDANLTVSGSTITGTEVELGTKTAA